MYNIFSTFFIVKKKGNTKINSLLIACFKFSFVAFNPKTWLFLHFTRHDPNKYYGYECVPKAKPGTCYGISCIYIIGPKDILTKVL